MSRTDERTPVTVITGFLGADKTTLLNRASGVSMVVSSSGITQLAWSPDDQVLAIGSEAGAVIVLKCDY